MRAKRTQLFFIILLFLSVIAVALALSFGAAGLSQVDSEIFWRVRTPRALLGFLVGGGLAIAGGVFQTLFRTPLATPFTLGVAGGASLGAALYLTIFESAVLSWVGKSGSAFIGALLTVVLLFFFQRMLVGMQSALSLLLIGVMLNFFFSSLILFLQYIGDFTQVFQISRWMMGSLETIGYESVWILAFGIGAAFVVTHYYSRALDLLSFGEEISASRGLNLKQTYIVLLVTLSLSTGLIVAQCGVIGFVGMIVPYICRMVVGTTHRTILTFSFLLGGIFLVLCDTIGRTIIAPAEIPVGVITALLGGPFFLGLLILGSKIERRALEFSHGNHQDLLRNKLEGC